ncbi:MAG: Hsp20/alpha crystallin family protein [Myxococcota bacterium]
MLVRWNDIGIRRTAPQLASWDSFRREMDRFFEDFDHQKPSAFARGAPRIHTKNTEQALKLRIEVPGMDEHALRISLEENNLTVEGTRALNTPEGYEPHRRERTDLEFTRRFTLPFRVDAEKTNASLQHGVLTLELHKQASEQPRKISVKSI